MNVVAERPMATAPSGFQAQMAHQQQHQLQNPHAPSYALLASMQYANQSGVAITVKHEPEDVDQLAPAMGISNSNPAPPSVSPSTGLASTQQHTFSNSSNNTSSGYGTVTRGSVVQQDARLSRPSSVAPDRMHHAPTMQAPTWTAVQAGVGGGDWQQQQRSQHQSQQQYQYAAAAPTYANTAGVSPQPSSSSGSMEYASTTTSTSASMNHSSSSSGLSDSANGQINTNTGLQRMPSQQSISSQSSMTGPYIPQQQYVPSQQQQHNSPSTGYRPRSLTEAANVHPGYRSSFQPTNSNSGNLAGQHIGSGPAVGLGLNLASGPSALMPSIDIKAATPRIAHAMHTKQQDSGYWNAAPQFSQASAGNAVSGHAHNLHKSASAGDFQHQQSIQQQQHQQQHNQQMQQQQRHYNPHQSQMQQHVQQHRQPQQPQHFPPPHSSAMQHRASISHIPQHDGHAQMPATAIVYSSGSMQGSFVDDQHGRPVEQSAPDTQLGQDHRTHQQQYQQQQYHPQAQRRNEAEEVQTQPQLSAPNEIHVQKDETMTEDHLVSPPRTSRPALSLCTDESTLAGRRTPVPVGGGRSEGNGSQVEMQDQSLRQQNSSSSLTQPELVFSAEPSGPSTGAPGTSYPSSSLSSSISAQTRSLASTSATEITPTSSKEASVHANSAHPSSAMLRPSSDIGDGHGGHRESLSSRDSQSSAGVSPMASSAGGQHMASAGTSRRGSPYPAFAYEEANAGAPPRFRHASQPGSQYAMSIMANPSMQHGSHGLSAHYDGHYANNIPPSNGGTHALSRQASSSSFHSATASDRSAGSYNASADRAAHYDGAYGVRSRPVSSHGRATYAGQVQSMGREEHPLPELGQFHLRDRAQTDRAGPAPAAGMPQLTDTWARLAARPESDEEANALLKPHIKNYLETSNKLLLGERTVVIMSTSVGQKSYGSERRFLVPPPSAFILGASWWTHLPDPYVQKSDILAGNRSLQLFAPTFQVAMNHDRIASEPTTEWTTYAGQSADKVASADDFPIAGRVVGKQLYIPDHKDDKSYEKDRHSVEALISVISPGLGPAVDRTIGTFVSKPIKVISKPSKKAQSNKKGNVYITHGGTIALFNRLRSQTVSTRFLCVSSAAASFPAWDWQAMSGQETKPFGNEQASCFTARTSAWDTFVVYAVDPRIAVGVESENRPPPPIGYPTPPANALPLPSNGASLPIYYNQPIVLQCMNTSVVSPVMVIRRVDKGSMALGGGPADSSAMKPVFDLPSAPGEDLGDAVSQLHKIALEVMPDPEAAYTNPVGEAGFYGGGSYLSCLGENVGVRKAEGKRVPFATDRKSGNAGAVSPSPENDLAGDPFDPSTTKLTVAMNRSRSQSLAIDGGREDLVPPLTNDGGKVKKLRRATSSLVSPIAGPAARNRKRGLSSSSHLTEVSEDFDVDSLWLQDAGEAGTWTIASTELTRHTFYIPPMLFDGLTPYRCKASNCPESFLTPIPSTPLTNLPVIRKYLVSKLQPYSNQARRMGAYGSNVRHITLYGENFGPEWTVWFGDIPSPGRVESSCSEVLECLEPSRESIEEDTSRHILLVRTDGVIVPSHVYWSP